jgi:nicotinamide riboside transporter PnuC
MDWTFIVTIAAITGTVANIYKKQWCFIIWVLTNTFWCIYDYSIGAKWQALQFLVYTGLAVWGLIQWRCNRDKRADSKK